jgi:hypothetical protein
LRKAFTLIELIAIIAIVATLVAISTPVFLSAIRNARATSGLNNFKQLHVAFSLYRSEHDGDGKYGQAKEMGLPNAPDLLFRGAHLAVAKDQSLWEPACGVHPMYRDRATVKYIYGPVNAEEVGEYYKKYQENAMLLVDLNCMDHSLLKPTVGVAKLLIGLRLSGEASKKTVYGFPDTLETNWNQ